MTQLPPISPVPHERKRGSGFARFRAWVCAILPLVPCCLLLVIGFSSPAQAADVAILKSSDISAYNQAIAGFKAALPAGTNFVEYDMQGDVAKGRKQAQRIRASDAALVLAVGLKAALVAKLEIIDIPVIFCMVLDPGKHDLKAPNMTGLLLEVPIERQLATLRTVLPAAKRVGVLYDPEKTGPFVEEARRRAKGFGLHLVSKTVTSEKEVPSALRGLVSEVDTLWLVPDSTVLTEDSLRFLLNTSMEASIPVLGFSPDLVKSGALVGLSVNYEDIGRQGGALARSILNGKGRSPALAPPERLRMSLNLKTARFLGITVPPEIVAQADDVY